MRRRLVSERKKGSAGDVAKGCLIGDWENGVFLCATFGGHRISSGSASTRADWKTWGSLSSRCRKRIRQQDSDRREIRKVFCCCRQCGEKGVPPDIRRMRTPSRF